MSAYYNENDPKAAAWLRELIKAGEIAAGEVDERSIEDVTPNEIKGFTQAHFFAGIGGWSRALRLAGWPDDKPVWTGSCPCQPFSAAGKRKGTSDERHLWPAWHWLVGECRPPVVFGEQVESAIRWGWLDLVSGDLEGSGYAVAAAVLAAGGVCAPHLRKRLWFVAYADGADARAKREQHGGELRLIEKNGGANKLADTLRSGWPEGGTESGRGSTAGLRLFGELGNSGREGTGRNAGAVPKAQGKTSVRAVGDSPFTPSADGTLGNSAGQRLFPRAHSGIYSGEKSSGPRDVELERSSATRNPWSECDWIYCTDGKWRPVEPGTFPLAHGIPARLGRLRGYGNAIVPQVAAAFIEAVG